MKKIKEHYKEYDIHELRGVVEIAENILEAQKQRMRVLDGKSQILIGFGGTSLAIIAIVLETNISLNPVTEILMVLSSLGMGFAAFVGLYATKTKLYPYPDMKSVTEEESATDSLAHYINDLIYSYTKRVELSRDLGGWLKLGERILLISISLFLTALGVSIFLHVCNLLSARGIV